MWHSNFLHGHFVQHHYIKRAEVNLNFHDTYKVSLQCCFTNPEAILSFVTEKSINIYYYHSTYDLAKYYCAQLVRFGRSTACLRNETFPYRIAKFRKEATSQISIQLRNV